MVAVPEFQTPAAWQKAQANCEDPNQIALERQSDQGRPIWNSGKHLVYSYPKTNNLFKSRKRKVFEILEDLPNDFLITKKGLNILFVH